MKGWLGLTHPPAHSLPLVVVCLCFHVRSEGFVCVFLQQTGRIAWDCQIRPIRSQHG